MYTSLHHYVTLNIKCWQHLHERAVCNNIFKQSGWSSLLALMALQEVETRHIILNLMNFPHTSLLVSANLSRGMSSMIRAQSLNLLA